MLLIDLDNSNHPQEVRSKEVSEFRFKAYHCTRAFEDDIRATGLKCFNLETRLAYLSIRLQEHGLPEELIRSYETEVRKDISGTQLEGRDGQIWFCLNRALFEEEDGCERLFKYFGGEAMYRIADHYPKFSDVRVALETMGQPLVVSASIGITTSPEFQVDRVKRKLCGELNEHCEIYIKENVPPECIIDISVRAMDI